ncbi:unnamed protein product [Darwinula stevensoni]|uniref:Uncharacterized protein n=1 Tax=Darwinula stevensoni TaxID=69355 RepID=A0A7R8WZR7_9CRUS|nr:unnamed protein product [Darwinula stevensoni]CAG0880324.1 unnamed protein product [Darwinula stevensoni]
MPRYESLSALIERANDWLARNPDCEAATCEGVECATTTGHVETETMTVFGGRTPAAYIRCLRLWLRRRNDPREPPQQLGHANFVPDVVDGTSLRSPKFQPISSMVEKTNGMLRKNPLPGKIITIETQEMKLGTYTGELDPDQSFRVEGAVEKKHFVFVIRIFYEAGIGKGEEIGLVDFGPLCEGSGDVSRLPKGEKFSSLVGRMSAWYQGQSSVRITNVQSLEYELESGEVDTRRTFYAGRGDVTTQCVRMLRVAYVGAAEAPLVPRAVACRTFVPVQLDRGGCYRSLEYEGMSKTRERIAAWMRVTGAKLISAETSVMRMHSGGEREKMGPEATHASDSGREAVRFTPRVSRQGVVEHWIYVIRLYLDGDYQEPDPGLLPPVPPIRDDSCCGIL